MQPIRSEPRRSSARATRTAARDSGARGSVIGDTHLSVTDLREPGPTGPEQRHAEDRRAIATRRRAHNEAKANLALALVGVSVFNAFAPLWGPAFAGEVQHPTRAALERMLASDSRIPTQGILSKIDAQSLQIRRAPLIEKADTHLDALDRALQLPGGTARTLAVERALVELGVAPADARDAAHLAAAAARATALAASLKLAVDEGRVDLTQLGVRGADALDRMLTDPHLTVAFAAGAALSPRIPAPAVHTLSTLGRIGHTLLEAKLRHDHALDTLKSLRTGNPIVDVSAHVAGHLADLAAFTLTFLGPGPFLAAARGTDLLLVAGQLIAAKTAVTGTAKAIGAYSNLPAEIVAFALGAAAEQSTVQAAEALRADARTIDAQVDTVSAGVADAVQTRDPQRALDAVLAAWEQGSPRERAALQQLLARGAERIATGAAHVQPGV